MNKIHEWKVSFTLILLEQLLKSLKYKKLLISSPMFCQVLKTDLLTVDLVKILPTKISWLGQAVVPFKLLYLFVNGVATLLPGEAMSTFKYGEVNL